jgi:very-short-patch-repair endonuclease
MTARKLRRDATDAEQLLWRAMREKLPDWKFRRQHPIGTRIADFVCPAAKLVIELDGGRHADHAEDDAARTAELGHTAIESFGSGTTRCSGTLRACS